MLSRWGDSSDDRRVGSLWYLSDQVTQLLSLVCSLVVAASPVHKLLALVGIHQIVVLNALFHELLWHILLLIGTLRHSLVANIF